MNAPPAQEGNRPAKGSGVTTVSTVYPHIRVAAVLRLKEKDQAFVEMESVVASTAILSFFSANQALIRNTPVIIAYSSRKQVTTNNSSSSTVCQQVSPSPPIDEKHPCFLPTVPGST